MSMLRYLGIITAALATIACCAGFPLSVQSDQGNITVFGIMLGDLGTTTSVIVDLDQNQSVLLSSASLVDAEDRLYDGVFDSSHFTKKRFFIRFEVPDDSEIKRLRFVPTRADGVRGTPFSIDLGYSLEASNETVQMKVYGVRSSTSSYSEDTKTWAADVRLKNNGSETLQVSSTDFDLVDQFGWRYEGDVYTDRQGNVESELLAPGESVRFEVVLNQISALSRPVALAYGNLSLDITAWTC